MMDGSLMDGSRTEALNEADIDSYMQAILKKPPVISTLGKYHCVPDVHDDAFGRNI